jgi:hypothetical protein
LTAAIGAIYIEWTSEDETYHRSDSARFVNVNHRNQNDKLRIEGFLGLGLDNHDEHQRLTRADHFVLVGGSAETHERMQDTAIRFNEELKRRGKSLQETSTREAIEVLLESMDR